MAKSKFEYVRGFEEIDKCLPNTWIAVRLDGRSFHKFSESHSFLKPNDECALHLMNTCAECVMSEFQDIVCAYGQSDEYSFILKKSSTLFGRRASKIMTTVVSYFTSCYVFHWTKFFPNNPLQYPPTFDGRVILYPSEKNVRDYLSWRQADCHINNLYNTCFWSLVHSGLSTQLAEKKLCGTQSSDKNEILFSEFGINYNTLPSIFRKGTFLVWELYTEEVVSRSCDTLSHIPDNEAELTSKLQKQDTGTATTIINSERRTTIDDSITTYRKRKRVVTLNIDIIGDQFWEEHNDILNC